MDTPANSLGVRVAFTLYLTTLQVVKVEEELQQYKSDNSKLSIQAQHDAQELLKLAERVQQQEMDITIMQEKHRTCQNEVTSRDKSILKLQSELDTAQQQYQGSIKEVRKRKREKKAALVRMK